MQISKVVCSPVPTNVEVPHADDGEAEETEQLHHQTHDEDNPARQRFSFRGSNGPVPLRVFIVLPTDLTRADELDEETEEVKTHKVGGDPPREAPQRFEVERVGWAGKPDYATECRIARCSKEAGGEQDHEP